MYSAAPGASATGRTTSSIATSCSAVTAIRTSSMPSYSSAPATVMRRRSERLSADHEARLRASRFTVNGAAPMRSATPPMMMFNASGLARTGFG